MDFLSLSFIFLSLQLLDQIFTRSLVASFIFVLLLIVRKVWFHLFESLYPLQL